MGNEKKKKKEEEKGGRREKEEKEGEKRGKIGCPVVHSRYPLAVF